MKIYRLLILLFCFSFINVELFAKSSSHVQVKNKPAKIEKKNQFPQDAYLDIEDDEIISVFDKPGKNWKMCSDEINNNPNTNEKDKCKALAWPDNGNTDSKFGNNTEIKILGEKVKRKTIDPISGNTVEEYYYPVSVKYKRNYPAREDDRITIKVDENGQPLTKENPVDKIGWIEASFVKIGKRKKEKEKKLEQKKEITDQNQQAREGFGFTEPSDVSKLIDKCNKMVNNMQPLNCEKRETIAETKKPEAPKKIKETKDTSVDIDTEVNLLMPVVGECVKDIDKVIEKMPKDKLTYDYFALPRVLNKEIPNIIKSGGSKLTYDDLINIDAVARTIYGEVGGCFKDGLQHPVAAAKVIINREQGIPKLNDPQYINDKRHDLSKPRISKVATKPSQFNVWNKSHTVKKDRVEDSYEITPNPALTHALCPDKPTDEEINSHRVSYHKTVWKKALKIATEAILHPDDFNKKTWKHTYAEYTSRYGKEKHNGMEPVKHKVLDEDLKPECVQLWEPPKESTEDKEKASTHQPKNHRNKTPHAKKHQARK